MALRFSDECDSVDPCASGLFAGKETSELAVTGLSSFSSHLDFIPIGIKAETCTALARKVFRTFFSSLFTAEVPRAICDQSHFTFTGEVLCFSITVRHAGASSFTRATLGEPAWLSQHTSLLMD